MPAASEYDCTRCAACCRCFPIFAGEADADREPAIRSEARRLPEHLASSERAFQLHPLPFLQACAFLGADRRCRIYASRPGVCRRFEPGSARCLEARARLGIR